MTLSFKPDIDKVKVNQCIDNQVKGHLVMILLTTINTHTDIETHNCSTWTTKVVGNGNQLAKIIWSSPINNQHSPGKSLWNN